MSARDVMTANRSLISTLKVATCSTSWLLRSGRAALRLFDRFVQATEGLPQVQFTGLGLPTFQNVIAVALISFLNSGWTTFQFETY